MAHRANQLESVCVHCEKIGDRSSFWFTDLGWMCDSCFVEYIKIPEEAKRKIFKGTSSGAV
jgi:hypothetical protein